MRSESLLQSAQKAHNICYTQLQCCDICGNTNLVLLQARSRVIWSSQGQDRECGNQGMLQHKPFPDVMLCCLLPDQLHAPVAIQVSACSLQPGQHTASACDSFKTKHSLAINREMHNL
jgi:hypothetical protein